MNMPRAVIPKRPKSARQIEQETMTPERIVEIIRSKGEFRVSWRYRDEWLIRICEKMRKAGVIQRLRGSPGANFYVLPDQG